MTNSNVRKSRYENLSRSKSRPKSKDTPYERANNNIVDAKKYIQMKREVGGGVFHRGVHTPDRSSNYRNNTSNNSRLKKSPIRNSNINSNPRIRRNLSEDKNFLAVSPSLLLTKYANFSISSFVNSIILLNRSRFLIITYHYQAIRYRFHLSSS